MPNTTNKPHTSTQKRKLLYFIGRYPEVTTTFIEREINVLRQLSNIDIKTISIRRPLTIAATSPDYAGIRNETLYLTPVNWGLFVVAHLFFIFTQPLTYFKTLVYLLRHEHPDLKARLMTNFHFGLGVYTAYLVRKLEFDHIHAHFIDRAVVLALIVGRLLKKSYSLTAHANSIFVKKILIAEKITNAAFAVTVSEHNKRYILQNYAALDSAKIHILHPWVNLEKFKPLGPPPESEPLRILCVGRLVEKKGHYYLVEACHYLQKHNIPFECRFLGDGPLRKKLESQIAQYKLQDHVHLLGEQPQQKVLESLSAWADVFALPCVIAKDGDRDGMPVSIAEAMAMAVPVVSTNILGIPEMVRPGSGFLVPDHNGEALADALEKVYHMIPEARLAMGQEGRMIIETDFNLIKGTLDLATLFQQTISARLP